MNDSHHEKQTSEPLPPSPHAQAQSLLQQAEAMLADHRSEEALASYEQALALTPDDAGLLLKTATLLGGLGRFEQAIRRFTQVLEREERADAMLLRAVAYANRGKAYLASDHPGKAARALSDCEQALTLLGETQQSSASPAAFQDALLLAQQGRQEAQALLAQITRLVEQNLGLIWPILTRYRHLWQGRLDDDEVFQEAALGLMRAAEKFDASRGYAFGTYAEWWIWQAVGRACRRTRLIILPEYQWTKLNRLARVEQAWQREHGREPSPEELATALESDPASVRFWLSLRAEHIVSLEQPLDEEEETTLAEIIPAPNDDATHQDALGTREVMAQLLATLALDERRGIELRYHLVPLEQLQGKDDPYPRPPERVGAVLGLTSYTVLKKEEHAFLKLRYWAEQMRRKETQRERKQE